MNSKKYNVVSLFSGAMGLDLGLHKTGKFRLLACVEVEKAFCATIRKNVDVGNLPDNPRIYEEDIRSLTPEEMLSDLKLKAGEVDVLIGGPPCQSFSTAGKRGTIQDTRGSLLWEFMRFVKGMKPKTFLMENVRGLLSAAIRHRPIRERPERGGPTLSPEEMPGSVVRLFAEDLQQFNDCPYHMDCFEVNAVNYGAPQLRERALFIGNRFNEQIDFPDPTHGSLSGRPKQCDLWHCDESGPLPWRTLGDAIRGLREDQPMVMDFSPRKKKFLSLVPPGGNWRHLPERIQKESMGKAFVAKGGRSGWWRRLSYELPCPTLVTMPNHASTALCHPEEVRALSVGEYCRIQEFPTNWIVCGTPAEQYRQIGNAVPVRLGEVAGATIASFLEKMKNRDWQPTEGSQIPYRRVYIQAHVRTRLWFKNGKVYVWADGQDNNCVAYSPMKTIRSSRVMGAKR
jgi:DNA (cytosine-5)-methyltransferase 1